MLFPNLLKENVLQQCGLFDAIGISFIPAALSSISNTISRLSAKFLYEKIAADHLLLSLR
jgi:hypothetical protein